MEKTSLIPEEKILGRIFLIRGRKVMLDKDLAVLYGVRAIALRQQVKRNIKRFPEGFMFHLTKEEASLLVSQNVIPSRKSLGGYLPYVFTEQGVAMLSSVLKSERAIQVNIRIINTFVKLREMISTHKELKQKIEEMEGKYDEQFKVVFAALKRLLESPKGPQKIKGFEAEN